MKFNALFSYLPDAIAEIKSAVKYCLAKIAKLSTAK